MSERLAAEMPAAAQPDGRLSVLEPALWQRLQAADTLAEAAKAWLTLQVRMLPAATGGCVLAPRDLSPCMDGSCGSRISIGLGELVGCGHVYGV